MKTLVDKAAIVTGGGSGIGRGTCLSLSGHGAAVAVADMDLERASSVAAEITSSGGQAIALLLDVNRQEQFESARDEMLRAFGAIDIVMNNVGVLAIGLPDQIPISEWERVLATNLLSLARSNAVFLPHLLEQGSGHIVNTASIAGLFASAYERLPYSAAKGGVVAVSEALALYLRPRGIGVTCLCPGPVSTNIGEFMQFSGPPVKLHGPDLQATTPDAVGELVTRAILDDQFLLLTHPEVQDLLIARAQDPEGFLDRQIAKVLEADRADLA